MSSDDQQLIKKGLQQLNELPGGKFTSLSKEEKLNSVKIIDMQLSKMKQIKRGSE